MSDVGTTERRANPVAVFRHELDGMVPQFQAGLPSHIPVERFARVVATAVQNNSELLECDRRSLWKACTQAATDGLYPDGREGAIVVRRQGGGKVANWQPMIAGIRKKARNSGEIATWDAHVVRDGDEFAFQLGDSPRIHHTFDLRTQRGDVLGAYSIATLKSGEKSYEVMTISEIHAIRDRSDAWKAFKANKIKSTPWASDEGEMAKKTVARRHSKVLPMSTDLDSLMHRDDEVFHGDDERQAPAAPAKPKTLETRLDALAAPPKTIEGSAAVETDDHDPETGEVTDESGEDERKEPGEAEKASEPATEWSDEECRKYGRMAFANGLTTKAAVPPQLREDQRRKELILEGFAAARAEKEAA